MPKIQPVVESVFDTLLFDKKVSGIIINGEKWFVTKELLKAISFPVGCRTLNKVPDNCLLLIGGERYISQIGVFILGISFNSKKVIDLFEVQLKEE